MGASQSANPKFSASVRLALDLLSIAPSMFKATKSTLVAILSLSLVTSALAQLGVSNLHLPKQSNGWTCNAIQTVAMSFTVGNSTPEFDLDSVTLWSSAPFGVTPFHLKLQADQAGRPGEFLTDFNGSITSTTFQDNTFTPVVAQTLTAGNTYWLVGTTITGVANYKWGYTEGGSGELGLPGWSIGNAPLFYFPNAGWQDLALYPAQFGINGQPVPEPASWSILGLGALSFLRRKIRSDRKPFPSQRRPAGLRS